MENSEINVLYSSDDNYAQHMGVSIYSLLENNSDFEKINVFVIDNGIKQENHDKLAQIISQFSNASIEYIKFDKYKNKLKLNMVWSISLSSYARLFVSDMLPSSINRVLYLDCDTIIDSSLYELWNIEMNGMIMGAVQDSVGLETKRAIGIVENEIYFNAGVLLIDLEMWRKNKISEKCLRFIDSHNGAVVHHDQGVLNGVLHNKILKLPLKYNLMTLHYFFSKKQILQYFNEKCKFYTIDEIDKSKESPAIIHFTPSFTSRPWVNDCKHPLKRKYWDILKKTPWRGNKAEKNKEKFHVRLVNWRYRFLPY